MRRQGRRLKREKSHQLDRHNIERGRRQQRSQRILGQWDIPIDMRVPRVKKVQRNESGPAVNGEDVTLPDPELFPRAQRKRPETRW